MTDIEQAQKFLLNIQWIDVVLFILAAMFLSFLIKFIDYFANLIAKQFPKNKMLILGWVPLLSFATYFTGIFFAIYVIINPSKDMILGFLASGLIAIGFALKDIVSSILAGLVLLVEKPFQIGDRIRFQGIYGDVTSIGLSSVTILTLDDGIVTVPNHLFINNIVDSRNAGKLGMITTVDIYISPEADLEEAKAIMMKIMQNNPFIDNTKEYTVIVKENLGTTGNITITMRTECVIKDVTCEKEFQSYFTIQANKALKEVGIQKNNLK
jgi:small-conductance mechanosensitive channel